MPVKSRYYTYLIYHKPTRKFYIGYSSTDKDSPYEDLGVTYFSSSKNLEFQEEQRTNPENFRYRVIGVYDTAIEARFEESLLHKKYNVGSSPRFFNRHSEGFIKHPYTLKYQPIVNKLMAKINTLVFTECEGLTFEETKTLYNILVTLLYDQIPEPDVETKKTIHIYETELYRLYENAKQRRVKIEK